MHDVNRPAGDSQVAASERLAFDAPQNDGAPERQAVVDGSRGKVTGRCLHQAEVCVGNEFARNISNLKMPLNEGSGLTS
jgi:hypothetical protein